MTDLLTLTTDGAVTTVAVSSSLLSTFMVAFGAIGMALWLRLMRRS